MARRHDILPGRGPDRRGFTLIEIVIAVAIVAILAGGAAPFVYREIERAREEATLRELGVLREGLLEFYEDTGRFPSEGEGLLALVTDPGAAGWSGPYVGAGAGDPSVEVLTDSWDNTYQYDLDPVTVPADAARAIVASAANDRILDLGAVGGTWTLAAGGDDLHAIISAGPLERDKVREAERELEAIAAAARRYFVDHAAFPASTADLSGTYMDPGVAGGAYVDPWQTAYAVIVDLGGANPPDLVLRSLGPDRLDQSGGGDDITLVVGSVPPAREATLNRLEVAQIILNQDPNLALSGAWATTDRAALNLAAVFDNDGWGREFGLNVGSRLLFSAGPDGDPATIADNIPPGVGP